ncbi:MAG: peptide-methionine (S)-S-oxide reductase MsrA [Candidatus Thiodiazotropha sp.]
MKTASLYRKFALLGASGLVLLGLVLIQPSTFATGTPITQNTPNDQNLDTIVLGMGCFWGAEKRMASQPGVVDVQSGYANGDVDPSYRAIKAQESLRRLGLSDKRNYAEVVKVTFDKHKTDLEQILASFWENHDPTQGDRQGNDVGSNYRSAIYTHSPEQLATAEASRERFQKALTEGGYGKITTEIGPLDNYHPAEEYHQNYLEKHPNGYCGLGGTGVRYPGSTQLAQEKRPMPEKLDTSTLDPKAQLIVFEAEDCAYCKQFKSEVLDHWQSDVAIARTLNPNPPDGWNLEKSLFATPTIVLFKDGQEVSRYTGYNGDKSRFWKWLGYQMLTPDQQRIAFEQGTERPFTGSHLDEKRPGTFVDPITGAPLFRSNTKFESGSGWPSFFNPVEGSITLHEDSSHGMHRVEVRSASSGIHLGHVFDDGPPPSHKRYCINGNVLKFVPDDI